MLEAIIESNEDPFIRDEFNPLLRGTEEQGFTFASDPDKEHSLGRYFLEEINSGRLDVRDAYERHWSYEEEAKLWGVGGRALFPDLEPMLLEIGPHLHVDKLQELVDVLTEGFFEAEKHLGENDYNPLYGNLLFAAKIIGATKDKHQIKTEKITASLTRLANLTRLNDDTSEALVNVGDEKAVDFLMQRIRDRDKFLYISAGEAYLLGEIGSERALDFLINYRCKLEAFIRGASLVKSERTVDYLIGLMRNESGDACRHAIEALGRYGGEKAVSALINYAGGRANTNRSSAVRALADVDCETAKSFLIEYIRDKSNEGREFLVRTLENKWNLPVLFEYLSFRSNTNRASAFEALGEIKCDESVEFLINCAQDASDSDRGWAIHELGRIGSDKAIPALRSFVADESDPERYLAAISLGKLAGDEVLDVLIESMEHEPRNSVVELLGKFKRQEAVPVLLRYLMASEDKTGMYSTDRGWAIGALGEIGGEQVFSAFVEYVKDRSKPDRDHVASKLGEVGGERAIPYMIEYIRDETNPHRENVAVALAKIGNDEVVPFLIECVEAGIGGNVACELGDMGSEKAFSYFYRGMTDRNNPQRYAAIPPVVNIRGEKAIPDVLACLEGADNSTISNATWALKKFGGSSSIKILMPLLKDIDEYARKTVFETINIIHQRIKPRIYDLKQAA